MPETLRIPGATPATLLGYLIGLGILRTVARQADPSARACWQDGALELHSELDAPGLERFLLDRWMPSPVVSPWNGGSGFFPKDNVDAFTAIEADTAPRLEPFRTAIRAARASLARAGLSERPEPKVAKPALLRDLRATLADEAIEWLDAAVILVAGAASFPPALGSGGNDGRYDIANNYAQAVVFALGLDTHESERRPALSACLWRTAGVLKKMSLAHLSRDASPVNSPAGESDALGNPWDLALAVEGSLLLAAGAVRRLDAGTAPGLAAPFTLRASAAGYGSAVDGEKGKAELWLPLWRAPASLAEVEVLFREARAKVGGRDARHARDARDGLDAARSASELGVARGIAAFQRFSILERAGLSNLAVPAGRIEVQARPAALVLRTLDPWLGRVLRHGALGQDAPDAQRAAIKQLEIASFAVAESGTPTDVARLLEALGRVEAQFAMSSEGSRPPGLSPIAPAAQPWLAALDLSSWEMRAAIALASVHDPDSSLPALRDYLFGTGRDEHGRRSYAAQTVGRVPSLAGVADRLAAAHERRQQDASRLTRAQLGFIYAVRCDFGDLARFVADDSMDGALGRLVDGLALLDYARVSSRLPSGAQTPDPLLGVLALAFGAAKDVAPVAPRKRASTADVADAAVTIGQPRRDWVARLRAGRVRAVTGEALLALRLSGLPPIPTADDLHTEVDGARLAAALLGHLYRADSRRLIQRLTLAPDVPTPQETPT